MGIASFWGIIPSFFLFRKPYRGIFLKNKCFDFTAHCGYNIRKKQKECYLCTNIIITMITIMSIIIPTPMSTPMTV